MKPGLFLGVLRKLNRKNNSYPLQETSSANEVGGLKTLPYEVSVVRKVLYFPIPLKIILTSFLILSLSSPGAYPLLDKLALKQFLIQQETEEYENKEYPTAEEYVQAFQEGRCSSVWLWIHLDEKGKIGLIDNLKQTFKEKDKVNINKPSDFYVKALDEAILTDSSIQNYKLAVLFRTIAVTEYDFDESIDKEETARKWLGPSYAIFKEYQKATK